MRIISIIGRDLRLWDNPLFDGWDDYEIIPVFLIDEFNQSEHGDNLKTLFFEYLKELQQKIKLLKSHLYIIRLRDFEEFLIKSKSDVVRYTLDGEPNTYKRGKFIESICLKNNVKFITLWNFLIKPEGGNFRFRFTDFYKRVFLPKMKSQEITILKPPKALMTPNIKHKDCDIPKYNKKVNILKLWFRDENDVIKIFKRFLTKNMSNYHIDRDFPSKNSTSKLSPYLRHGVISLKLVYLMANEHPNSDPFLKEIAWGEYFRIWLHNFPHVVNKEFRQKWVGFPWIRESPLLEKWQKGETGFDIVDAGMRQLQQEGWMHNRARMITASFLTKNLLLDWRLGERFFYENLIDADLSSNVGNWQWVAGCGLDAVPHFRLFNPEIQLNKFDPERIYVSKYLNQRHPKIINLYQSRLKFLNIARQYQNTKSKKPENPE